MKPRRSFAVIRTWAVVLACAAAPACQCLVPVEEFGDAGRRDGGSDAGRDGGAIDGGAGGGTDAGTDAGALTDGGSECATAPDCTGTPWSSRWCLGGDAGFSCVEHQCVSECPGPGQTCAYDAGTCLQCGTTPPLCAADTCPTAAFTAIIESVECRPGVTPPLAVDDQLSFVPVHGASCEMSVVGPSGSLGQVTRGQLVSQQTWFIRALGGTCVGQQLPTGAIRSSVACPLCTFAIEGF